ncbi:hypothetical protein RHMOL_Rhmol04G0211200 [Rhododendron molle]|uniref:Uncharacterized protein n=1 Tax=Rhododendron molle TaxID=49168 RepID=A0ACC0P4I7_RHOML|nr:hypothetical protein RHMOL_Rhmol04G0211200 [Rhododendron molle]
MSTSLMARRVSTEVEEQMLLTNVTNLVDEGIWEGNGNGWHPGYLAVLQNQMQASLPQAGIEQNHIATKMKAWKREYSYLATMLHCPGFGWNANEKRLVVEDEVWNDFFRVRSSTGDTLSSHAISQFHPMGPYFWSSLKLEVQGRCSKKYLIVTINGFAI